MTTQSNAITKAFSWPKELFLVIGAALFLSLMSQLSIPLHPVPLTFQSVSVLLIGMVLGPRLGAYAVILYFAAGIVGLPVFANFSMGIGAFLDPAGGYLLGFLPAVIVGGYLAQRRWIISAAFFGTLIIFSFGFLFLSQLIGSSQAWILGVKPFLISEPIKLIILCLFMR